MREEVESRRGNDINKRTNEREVESRRGGEINKRRNDRWG